MGSFILQGSGTMQPHGANGTCLRQLQVPKMDPARFVWAPTSITATPRTVAAQSDNCAVFIPSREGLACISGVNSDTFVVQPAQANAGHSRSHGSLPAPSRTSEFVHPVLFSAFHCYC